jgi:PAS domain S-box-containing protein
MASVTTYNFNSFSDIGYRTLFDSSPDAAIIVNEGGEIILCNNQVKEIFGYTKEELISEKVEILIPAKYWKIHNAHMDRYYQEPHVREMGKGMELLAIKKDGTEFPTEISLSPIIINNVTFVFAAIRDVSDKKQLLNQIKLQQAKLSEQNKRLLNFAYIVSHNLKSHSGNLGMMLNFFNNAITESDKIQAMKHVQNISSGLSNTIEHLNQIVALQTTNTLERKVINLRDYVDEAIDILSGEIFVNKGVVVNNVSGDITLTHNPAYMESILLNFISNTIKYKHPDRNPICMLNAYYEKERLVLEICDNGIGIDLSQHREKLFGLFKTFHGNIDAQGIGLFISKNQVEAFGGEIEVQSEINVGTTFKIFLS